MTSVSEDMCAFDDLAPGSVRRFEGDSETATFLLGSRELLTLDSAVDLDVYSPTSPLGEAISGKSVGDKATYQTPNGASITVEIVDAVPF